MCIRDSNNDACAALADYVLNGRPETKSDKLFIRSLAPFEGFRDGVSINNILRRRSADAGVMVGGKNTIHGIRTVSYTHLLEAVKDNFPSNPNRKEKKWKGKEADLLKYCGLE